MKNLKNSIFIFLISMVTFGCSEEEFLDEKPITQISTKSFFETSKQFEQSVNGAYQELQDLTRESYWMLQEVRSDVSTFQVNLQNQAAIGWNDIDLFTIIVDNSLIYSTWNNLYQGIEKCNTTLHYIKDVDVENKDRYIVEVKFLRAFYYFNLVQYFGDVPLITDIISSREDALNQNKRVAKDKVYEQILADLNDAKNYLPKSYSAENAGRATEGAARTLLADVLMWQGRYKDAATELETVINSQQYSLLADYSSVFDIKNENNKEIVFDVQFIEGPNNLGSSFMYRFLPWNSGNKYLPFPQSNSSTGFNIPTEDLIESFERGDKRKSMIDTTWIDHENYTYHNSIVPFTKKFMDKGHTINFITGSNFPIFRYPHVLLMLAECYSRQGGGNPVLLVNQVRIRAGLPALASVTLNDIINERKIEFHCEGDRWGVLVRTGLAKEVMIAHGMKEKKRPNIQPNTYGNIKLLYPIPDNVLSLDPTMQQNPEYVGNK
jgi:hypothetical protein